MKHVFTGIFILSCLLSFAQPRRDSIATVAEIAAWYDVDLSVPERDSLIEGIQELHVSYKNMHKLPTPNSLPYPFAFNPMPVDFSIPQEQQSVNWNIPDNISLPRNKNEIAFYAVSQLASLIKNKKISSVELTKFFLDRLKKYNDTLKCVISFTEDIAMEQARNADAEIRNGVYRGPLHGIPYGLKDLFAVKGTKTTWGSTPYRDQVVDEDAFVYQQLKKAGAVLCAKLSLGALAYNDLWFGGRTNNPWNLAQGSSGSSAGSAAATSAGLLPFAIGTETWGSIVSPSHRCGVTGLRPTFGSVSRSGAMVLSWSLDKIGPICRSADDAAIVFSYIMGTDGKDPSAVQRAFNYTGKADLKKLRIAYAGNYFQNLPPTAQQWNLINMLKSSGADVKEVQFPDSTIYRADIMNPILSSEAAAAFDELTRNNKDDLIERQDKNFWPNIFRTARFIPAVEYINANRHRYTLLEAFNKFIQQYDAVIVPSFSGNQLAITNLTGHPAICFPVGFTEKGFPNSITIIGNLYDEATILSVAKAFQDATDHHKKHPPLFK